MTKKRAKSTQKQVDFFLSMKGRRGKEGYRRMQNNHSKTQSFFRLKNIYSIRNKSSMTIDWVTTPECSPWTIPIVVTITNWILCVLAWILLSSKALFCVIVFRYKILFFCKIETKYIIKIQRKRMFFTEFRWFLTDSHSIIKPSSAQSRVFSAFARKIIAWKECCWLIILKKLAKSTRQQVDFARNDSQLLRRIQIKFSICTNLPITFFLVFVD